MLEYCLQQPIDTSGYFPDNICVECTSKLVECYEFFVLYKKSEEHFLLLYRNGIGTTNGEIKIETIDEPMNYDVLGELVDTEFLAVGGAPPSVVSKAECDSSEDEIERIYNNKGDSIASPIVDSFPLEDFGNKIGLMVAFLSRFRIKFNKNMFLQDSRPKTHHLKHQLNVLS